MDALVYPSIPVATEEPKSLLETVNALKRTIELLTGTGDRGKVQRPTDRNVIHTFVQDTQPQAWNVGDLWLCKYPKVTLSCWDGKVWVLLLETIAATVPPGTGPAGPPGPPGPPGASGVGYGVDATVLDFINDSYDQTGSVTLAAALNVIRASVGIVPNADGTWTEMAVNVARRGVGTGLLIEAGSTNRLLWCHDPSNAVWTKSNLALSAAPSGPVASRGNGTRVTATGNNAYLAQTYTTTTGVSFTATIAGDQMTVSAVSLGVLGATQIVTGVGVAGNTEIVTQVSGVGGVRGGPGVYTLNNSQTVSTPTVMNVVYNRVPSLLIMRAVGTGPIYLSQDGGVTQTDISDQLITGKWVQAYTPYDARVSPQWRLTVATYGDAVDVDYAQLEDKTYPSSPIFTTSAQASRSTDEVYLNLATFPAFINSDKLTVLEVAKPLNENVHTSGYLDQDIWTWLTIQGFDVTPVGTVTGSIASTATMTVTAATVGLKLYQGLTGGGTPVLPDTTLFAQFSGTPGGAGVWSVLPIQTTPSQTMNVVPNHAYFCNAIVKPVTNRRNVGVTVVNTTTTRNYYGFDPQTQEYAYRRWNRLGFSTTASLKEGIVALNGDVEHSQAPFNDAWPDASKFDTVVLGGQMPGAVNSLNGFIAQLVIMPDQAWTAQQLADWTSDDVDTPPTWAEITDKPSTFPPTMPLGIYIATDYGIVGDGTTDNAVTLQSLIDAVFAAGGGTIKLPRGVYRLDAQIRLKDKVYLQGEGPGLSTLDFSQKSFYQNPGNGSGGLAGPYGACIFQTGGSTSNQVSVTANVVEGAVQIAVSSIVGFNPGDWIIIRTTLQEGAAGKIADICHVEWADSGFIYIQQPVAHNYLIGSGTVSVVKLNTVTSGVSDLTVKGKGVNPASMPLPLYTGVPPGDAPGPALTYDQRGDDGIEFRYGKDCFVDNVAFVGVEGVCTLFSVSIGTKVTRSVFTFDSIHCFPQYGVYPQTANINTWIEGNKFYNGRHHISTGYVNATSQDYYFGSPNGIVITKNHCFGSWVYPIDSHEAAVNIVITDNIIEGLSGGIEVRGKWVTVTGNIISLPTPAQGIPGISEGFGVAVRMAQENITISGNRIVGGSIGIYFGAVTTGPNTRAVVANNVINRSFSACIQLDAGMDNFAITGNVGQVLSGGTNSNVIYVNGCKGGSITGNTCIIDQPAPLFASGIRTNSTAVGDTSRIMISANTVIDKGSGGTTTGIQIDLDSTEVIIGHNNVSSCTNPTSPAVTTGSITVASLSSDLKGRTLTLAQGTITAAERMIEAQSTWNNVAVTFTGFYQNITDTASAAGSYLLDLRVGGSTKFSVSKIGTIGVGVAQTTAMNIRNSAPLTGGAGAYGYYNDGQVQSDVTSAVYNRLHVSSAAGTSGASIWGYWVSQGTLTGPITTQFGFYADANFKDATTSYGFYGNLAAGTGKWNFYAAGTAGNYLGGPLGMGALTLTGFAFRNSLNMVGSSGVTRANYSGGAVQSDVTSSASYFEAAASTQAAAFTLPSLYYYLATQGNITGGGSAVTAQYGFYASANMVGAGTNYAYYSGLPAAANNWAFYSIGTAESYTRGGWTTFGNTAIPAGGTAGTGYKFSSTANYGVFFGSGAPTLAAAKGSLYLRSDGSTTNDRAYINTNGSTTWTALTTAA